MKHAILIAAVASIALSGCANPKAKSTSTTQPAPTTQAAGPVTAASLLAKVRPSLVVVQYTYDGEMGRQEVEGAGIVVGSDGLIAVAGSVFPGQIPTAQMMRLDHGRLLDPTGSLQYPPSPRAEP